MIYTLSHQLLAASAVPHKCPLLRMRSNKKGSPPVPPHSSCPGSGAWNLLTQHRLEGYIYCPQASPVSFDLE